MNAYENTDKEIWRKIEGEYYSPRIFVTKEGNVGINVGGNAYVQSVEEWHKQADRIAELEKELKHEYWCVHCGRALPIEDGVIVHDDVIHPAEETFDEESRPQ